MRNVGGRIFISFIAGFLFVLAGGYITYRFPLSWFPPPQIWIRPFLPYTSSPERPGSPSTSLLLFLLGGLVSVAIFVITGKLGTVSGTQEGAGVLPQEEPDKEKKEECEEERSSWEAAKAKAEIAMQEAMAALSSLSEASSRQEVAALRVRQAAARAEPDRLLREAREHFDSALRAARKMPSMPERDAAFSQTGMDYDAERVAINRGDAPEQRAAQEAAQAEQAAAAALADAERQAHQARKASDEAYRTYLSANEAYERCLQSRLAEALPPPEGERPSQPKKPNWQRLLEGDLNLGRVLGEDLLDIFGGSVTEALSNLKEFVEVLTEETPSDQRDIVVGSDIFFVSKDKIAEMLGEKGERFKKWMEHWEIIKKWLLDQ